MTTSHAIIRNLVIILTGTVLVLTLSCCSDNRAQAVRSPQNDENDYREMLSRVRDRRKAKDDLALLRKSVGDCQVAIGRLPTNLVELVRLGYVDSLPEPPEGATYAYDPIRGRIELLRTDGNKQQRKRKKP